MLFQSKLSKLFTAVREGRDDRLRELLDSGGADLEERAEDGRTLLVAAADEARPGLVKLLLAAGAHPDTPAASGDTPLITAAHHGFSPIMELLIKSGAALNLTDRGGATALYAATVWATRMASLGVTDTKQKLTLLLDSGANPSLADKMGRTPLIASVRSGGGAIEETNRLPVLSLLLERGAEVDAVSRRGRTALSSACFRGLKESSILLIEAGAALDHRDNHGRTPLMNVAEGCFWSYRRAGYIGLLNLLLDRGADPTLKDNSRNSALALARRHRHQDLVQILEKFGVRE